MCDFCLEVEDIFVECESLELAMRKVEDNGCRRLVGFTRFNADGVPRVNLAFSDDGGKKFGPPVRMDEGKPLGRVAVELMPDGSALVLWIEWTE